MGGSYGPIDPDNPQWPPVEQPPAVDLGQVAYEAYGDSRDWKTVAGSEMPVWSDQSEALQEAWRAAADAVAQEVVCRRPR